MPKAVKQKHKTTREVSQEMIDKDIAARAAEFNTRVSALQLELKMKMIGELVIHPNNTIGAKVSLVDTKHSNADVSDQIANPGS